MMGLDGGRLNIAACSLGAAQVALNMTLAYMAERKAFGKTIDQFQALQFRLADMEIELQAARTFLRQAAWKLDQGDKAQKEVSMAKIHVADVLHKAADTGVQLCGAKGYSKDTLLDWIYRYARCARLVDGASEVHKMVLARHYSKLGNDFWEWG